MTFVPVSLVDKKLNILRAHWTFFLYSLSLLHFPGPSPPLSVLLLRFLSPPLPSSPFLPWSLPPPLDQDEDFDSAGGSLGSSMKRVKNMAKAGHNCWMCYLILFSVAVFFVCCSTSCIFWTLILKHSQLEKYSGYRLHTSSCYTHKEYCITPIFNLGGVSTQADHVQKSPFYASLWWFTVRDMVPFLTSYHI